MKGLGQVDASMADIQCSEETTPFTDSVCCIAWAKQLPQDSRVTLLAVTTWNAELRIFNVERESTGWTRIVQKFWMALPSIAMDIEWVMENTALLIGCTDHSVKVISFPGGVITHIGQHKESVKNVFYCQEFNAIISTSYDKTISLWHGSTLERIELYIGYKVFVADFACPILVAGLSHEKVLIMDIRYPHQKVIMDSALGDKSQLQSIAISRDTKTIVIGSIDGRINISSLTFAENVPTIVHLAHLFRHG